MIGVQILYKSVVLSVWACLWHTTSLSQWTQLRNEFVLWWFYRHAFFQVRWGSGSIVSVRWVHLDNPRMWECGNEWECNTQTASTLPHQSDYKIHFYDLMWPSLILHCSSTLLAFILVHNDLSIRSDSAGLLEKVFEGFLSGCFEVSTPAFSSLSEWPEILFVCPHWNSYSRMFCDTEHNKLAQAPELWCHLANETPSLVMTCKEFLCHCIYQMTMGFV